MKIQVLSDIHNEYSPFEPVDAGADVVVLAGDVDNGVEGLRWARQAFPRSEIIYVLGNHEFYGWHWHRLLAESAEAARRLGIHLLEDSVATIGEVRFLGSSFWVDFALLGEADRPLAMRIAGETQSDYTEIEGNPQLKPADVLDRHQKSRAFIQATLASQFDGKTVVVTHHLPSTRSLTVKREWYHVAYCSNADECLGKSSLWIHGHTHSSCDYQAGETRVLCNPRGRVEPAKSKLGNRQFDPILTVEI